MSQALNTVKKVSGNNAKNEDDDNSSEKKTTRQSQRRKKKKINSNNDDGKSKVHQQQNDNQREINKYKKQGKQHNNDDPKLSLHGNLTFEQLKKIKIRQRNVCFVVGLPIPMATEQILASQEWFGHFGNITFIAINRSDKAMQVNSTSAHITYNNDMSALNAIDFCNNFMFEDGRKLKATFGSHHYCPLFIKGYIRCTNVSCHGRHSWCGRQDVITQNDMNDFLAIPSGAYTSRNIEHQPSRVRGQLTGTFHHYSHQNATVHQQPPLNVTPTAPFTVVHQQHVVPSPHLKMDEKIFLKMHQNLNQLSSQNKKYEDTIKELLSQTHEYEKQQNASNEIINENKRRYESMIKQLKIENANNKQEQKENLHKKDGDKNMKTELKDLKEKMIEFAANYDKNTVYNLYQQSAESILVNDEINDLDLTVRSFSKKLLDLKSYIISLTIPDINKYKEWNIINMILWISSLENGRYKQYKDRLQSAFESDGIDAGDCLPDLTVGMLRDKPFNITNFRDRRDLSKHFQSLKSHQILNDSNNNNNNNNENYEGFTQIIDT